MDSSKANFATGKEGNESSLLYISMYVQISIYTDIYLYVELLVEALILAMLASSSSYQNAPKGFEMLCLTCESKQLLMGKCLVFSHNQHHKELQLQFC